MIFTSASLVLFLTITDSSVFDKNQYITNVSRWCYRNEIILNLSKFSPLDSGQTFKDIEVILP